jgi:zinc/manganese transport system permease protein
MLDFFIVPFAADTSRHALVAILALALGSGPVGVVLMLRRMALMGDTMSHAILPGVAVAVALAGFDTVAMTVGGIAAGLVVALLAGLVSRATPLKEDSSLAAFFLLSLALGVVLLSATGRDEQIVHVLFGDITELDTPRLTLIAAIASVSLLSFAVIWRPLVLECVDPQFLRTVSGAGAWVHYAFLVLVVLNLVAGYQALGTLLAIGLTILPAVSARFWSRDLTAMLVAAILIGIVAGYTGLLVSYHAGVAAGPAIVLSAGVIYIGSVLFGPQGGVLRRAMAGQHLEA